jgi:hypothetical protein
MRVARLVGLAIAAVASLGGTEALAQPAAPAPAPAPSAPPAATRPMVVVHLDSPQPVTLEGRSGDDDDWEVMCTAPCDRPVPTTFVYRITGSGVRTSRTFHVDAGSRVTLQVDPSSSAGHAGAIVITVVGSVGLVPIAVVTALLLGGWLGGAIFVCPIVTAFAQPQSAQSAAYGNCMGYITNGLAPGYTQPYVWIPAVAGTALLTAGIVWIVKTPPSRVSQTAATPPVAMPAVMTTDQLPRFEAVRVPPAPVVQLIDLRF